MFTGIIEDLALVKTLSLKAGGGELFLDFSGFYNDLMLGESIAINGACLTVKQISGRNISFDVSGETLKKTTLGKLHYGEKVNIERALRVGDRLGGHFVTGHVDGTGSVQGGDAARLRAIEATPVGRAGTPAEVADAVLFLASERAA